MIEKNGTKWMWWGMHVFYIIESMQFGFTFFHQSLTPKEKMRGK
jgi:hypothetical protein